MGKRTVGKRTVGQKTAGDKLGQRIRGPQKTVEDKGGKWRLNQDKGQQLRFAYYFLANLIASRGKVQYSNLFVPHYRMRYMLHMLKDDISTRSKHC